jgi:shikimate kinase
VIGHVVVIGMMGSGKSTLGRALSAKFDVPYLDSDDEILRLQGVDARQLAETHSVAFLHQIEADILLAALDSEPPVVVTAAASVIEEPTCRERLRGNALVCWIDVPADVLAERIRVGPHRRPMSNIEIEATLARRSPLFADISAIRVDGCLPVDQLVECVEDIIRNRVVQS